MLDSSSLCRMKQVCAESFNMSSAEARRRARLIDGLRARFAPPAAPATGGPRPPAFSVPGGLRHRESGVFAFDLYCAGGWHKHGSRLRAAWRRAEFRKSIPAATDHGTWEHLQPGEVWAIAVMERGRRPPSLLDAQRDPPEVRSGYLPVLCGLLARYLVTATERLVAARQGAREEMDAQGLRVPSLGRSGEAPVSTEHACAMALWTMYCGVLSFPEKLRAAEAAIGGGGSGGDGGPRVPYTESPVTDGNRYALPRGWVRVKAIAAIFAGDPRQRRRVEEQLGPELAAVGAEMARLARRGLGSSACDVLLAQIDEVGARAVAEEFAKVRAEDPEAAALLPEDPREWTKEHVDAFEAATPGKVTDPFVLEL